MRVPVVSDEAKYQEPEVRLEAVSLNQRLALVARELRAANRLQKQWQH
jgi:hypothetical protein